jgi:hypothetical protein
MGAGECTGSPEGRIGVYDHRYGAVAGGEQNRHAVVLRQANDQLEKLLAAERIESGGRLVEQQHARLVDERLGETDFW